MFLIRLTTKSQLEDMFLRKKPVRLLMALKLGGPVKYISMLSKETDCTYSHTVKLLDNFRELGLVNFDKIGRVKYIKLTSDGLELAGYFENVLRKFSKLNVKDIQESTLDTSSHSKKASKPIQIAASKQKQQKQD